MANMYLIIAAFITAIVLGRIIIPNILIISLRKRLFDAPDARKIHKRPIPRLGGVTFFPVILCTTCFFTALRILLGYLPDPQFTVTMVTELLFLIAGLTLLYIVGIADDLMGVRYRKKFFVQIISAAFFPLAGLYINNFYGLFVPVLKSIHNAQDIPDFRKCTFPLHTAPEYVQVHPQIHLLQAKSFHS